MARKSKLSAQEIAELDETKTREVRNLGLKMMPIRDIGSAQLSNGKVVRWHGKPTPIDYETPHGAMTITEGHVPSGTFEVDGTLYNAEELRKYLRWA